MEFWGKMEDAPYLIIFLLARLRRGALGAGVFDVGTRQGTQLREVLPSELLGPKGRKRDGRLLNPRDKLV